VTLPLAVAGTQVAHTVAYRLTTPSSTERAHELSATGHGYVAYLPLALAMGVVLVAFALVAEVRHIAAASPGHVRPRAWHFAVVAPAIFVAQEHLERLVHNGAMPWQLVLAASFITGLLLQVPFALAAYVVARLLVGAARTVGGLLASRRRPPFPAGSTGRPASRVTVPRLRALALGYGSRGPPLALR
jgi:hypothetical protein